MLYDGIQLIEGSSIDNAAISTGTVFPNLPSVGELFYRSDEEVLYVYDGAEWDAVGSGSGGGVSDAVDLTGTTLAANVVSSSLTSVGTITSGTWSGAFGEVSGNNLTNLNASNLGTGTVPTARLASGTASSTTFLRGDRTWATLSVDVISAIGALSSTTTTGVHAGVTGSVPALSIVNGGTASGARAAVMTVQGDGRFTASFRSDDWSTSIVNFLEVTRSGSTPTLFSVTSTAVQLNGVTTTSVSNPTRGIAALIQNSATTGRTGAQLLFNQAGIADWVIGQPADTSAFVIWSARSPAGEGQERLRISADGALGIGGSNFGTSGQVLTSAGAGAAPSWQAVTAPAPTQVPRATSYGGNLADRGNRIAISAGVSLPAGVYSGGDAFSFYNSSASTVTIAQGAGLTLRQDGTANTGNRTLAPYGTCFVWYNTASEAVISGSLT